MRKTTLLLLSTVIFSFLFSSLVLAATYDCDYSATKTIISTDSVATLSYGGHDYQLILTATNTTEKTAIVKIDGTSVNLKEGTETTLPDGRVATVWNVFHSSKDSTPSSATIQIGEKTYIDCQHANHDCDYSEQTTLVLNKPATLTYGSTDYNLELIAVNVGENKATVKVDGTTILIQDGAETTLADGNKATTWNIFGSTKADTPDTAVVQIGAATYLNCSVAETCANANSATLVENQETSCTYSGTNYKLNLIAVNDDEQEARIDVNDTATLFDKDVLKTLSGSNKLKLLELFISTKASTPQSASIQFCGGNTNSLSCSAIVLTNETCTKNPRSVTLVKDQKKSYTYSGTNYELKLIGIESEEQKVSVMINDTGDVFKKDATETLSDGRKMTVRSIYVSSKESTPSIATLEFCGGETNESSESIIDDGQEQDEQEQDDTSSDITDDTNAPDQDTDQSAQPPAQQSGTQPPAASSPESQPEKFFVLQWIDSIVNFFAGLFG